MCVCVLKKCGIITSLVKMQIGDPKLEALLSSLSWWVFLAFVTLRIVYGASMFSTHVLANKVCTTTLPSCAIEVYPWRFFVTSQLQNESLSVNL